MGHMVVRACINLAAPSAGICTVQVASRMLSVMNDLGVGKRGSAEEGSPGHLLGDLGWNAQAATPMAVMKPVSLRHTVLGLSARVFAGVHGSAADNSDVRPDARQVGRRSS